METILISRGEVPCVLNLPYANRHGLIAGATGTGKTITLQVLAEGFSRAGVPVFCADVKGDLAGISQPGLPNTKLAQRAAELGMADYVCEATPTLFWDLYGQQGHPIRATVADMGPVLLSRILELNDTQEGALTVAFALADAEGLLLLDLKDLRAILNYVADRAAEVASVYGHASKATIGIIARRLLTLEQAGAAGFLGEPPLDIADLMRLAPDGRGAVSVLAADRLIQSPRLYAMFLLWLLSALFEQLPEEGDLPKPKLVFFFDEAHLLFKDAPRALLDKVEQVVRLIRSKGVGVYFVTQNPTDLPSSVLGQLGNRVQHALRAFSATEQKSVRAAAGTFRANPKFKVEGVITELAVGEALVSTLQHGGVPGVVERARVCPPRSRMGSITLDERAATIRGGPISGRYDTAVDRESAYERLQGQPAAATLPPAASVPPVRGASPWGDAAASAPSPSQTAPVRVPAVVRPARPPPPQGASGSLLNDLLLGDGRRQGVAEAMAKSVVRGLGSSVGRQVGGVLVRGLLGSLSRR
jgi:DNA helicase HerA-like ATPase